MLDQRRVEGLALAGVIGGVLEGGAGEADGERADPGARRSQRAQRALAAAAEFRIRDAQAVVGGDAHFVEREVRRVAGADAHLVPDLQLREAGRVVGHDERRDIAPARAVALAREDDRQIRDAAAGDEALRAIDHVFVAVAHRAGLDCAGVGAGVGLGQRERAEPQLAVVAGAERQEALALLLGADHRDRGRRQPADLGAQRDAGAAPGELFGGDHRGDARLRGLPAQRHAGQPDFGRLGRHIPGELVALVILLRDGAHLIGGEFMRRALHHAVGFGEGKGGHGMLRAAWGCWCGIRYHQPCISSAVPACGYAEDCAARRREQ